MKAGKYFRTEKSITVFKNLAVFKWMCKNKNHRIVNQPSDATINIRYAVYTVKVFRKNIQNSPKVRITK